MLIDLYVVIREEQKGVPCMGCFSIMVILITLCQLLVTVGMRWLHVLHLAKTYCAPAAMYGCETWHLDRSDYHRLNVDSFRRIFGCCWRESVACLQFYCHTFPWHI